MENELDDPNFRSRLDGMKPEDVYAALHGEPEDVDEEKLVAWGKEVAAEDFVRARIHGMQIAAKAALMRQEDPKSAVHAFLQGAQTRKSVGHKPMPEQSQENVDGSKNLPLGFRTVHRRGN